MRNRQVRIKEFGGPNVIQVIESTDLPQPLPGEVRIKVEASSAVFTDTVIRRGLYPYLSVEPPFTLGYDVVGVIDALGEGVTDWQVGQRVADIPQLGANADYLCRPATHLIPVPDGLDPAEAVSLILSYVTAYQMLHRVANVQAGQRILVHGGAGAVGTALLQLGRQAGVEVVATASAGKRDVLEANGAIAFNHQSTDIWKQLKEYAPAGYDAVFDGVGIGNFAGSYLLLGPQGTLVTFGAVHPAARIARQAPTPGEMVKFMFSLVDEMAAVLNAFPDGRSFRPYAINTVLAENRDWFITDLGKLFAMLAAHKIRPVIDERLSLNQAAEAHGRVETGQVRGRLVFDTRL